MTGFRDFLLRGNLVELAVAVIIGTSFGAVVTAFTGMLMDVVGLFGGTPDFSNRSVGGISVGGFLTALISFVFTAAIVYFFVVLPYNKLKERTTKAEQAAPVEAPTTESLLVEIRDLLKAQTPPGP